MVFALEYFLPSEDECKFALPETMLVAELEAMFTPYDLVDGYTDSQSSSWVEVGYGCCVDCGGLGSQPGQAQGGSEQLGP